VNWEASPEIHMYLYIVKFPHTDTPPGLFLLVLTKGRKNDDVITPAKGLGAMSYELGHGF
jgi:hypothetical protein